MRLLSQFVIALLGVGLIAIIGTFGYGRREEPYSLLLYSSNFELYRTDVEGHRLDKLTSRAVIVQNVYWTPDNTWMLVSGTHVKDYRVYRMRPDGSHQQDILPSLRSIRFLSWSPDGKWMAFTADHPTRDINLYVSRPDGRNIQQITFGNEYVQFQTWSPDREWLYFLANRDDQLGIDLFRIHPDGTGREDLTNNPSIVVGFVAWSTNGEWMILSVRHHERTFIYRMRPDGHQLENLTDKYNRAMFRSFSPDGEWIYFTANTNRGLKQYSMRINGNDKQPLEDYLQQYDIPIAAQYSNWSPNGKWVVFQSHDENNAVQFFHMDQLGNNLEQLTDENEYVQSHFLEWSPNSAAFVYFTVSIRDVGGPKIYKLWRDNGNVIQLPHSTWDEFLGWSPDGEWLIFRHYPSQSERETSSLYAIRRDGTDKHTIVPLSRYVSFHGWTPPFELEWNTSLLITIGIVLIGMSIFLMRIKHR